MIRRIEKPRENIDCDFLQETVIWHSKLRNFL